MKFTINRSSDVKLPWVHGEKPCEGAREETYIYKWMVGKKEKEEERKKWTIEINTLEELVEFIESNDVAGEIVMGEDWIEIYDDYRE